MIGILGGMGPAATVDFFRRIVDATPARCDQDHLHLIIDDDPSVPDRTSALLGVGASPGPSLLSMGRRLAAAGAELLVAPCNTASAFLPPVAREVGVPLLQWNAAVVGQLARQRSPGHRVGILATTGTARTRLYQDPMLHAELVPMLPPDGLQMRVMDVIRARKAGVPRADLVAALSAAVAQMRLLGADDVLLACTELSDIFAASSGIACTDAMDLVVERLMEMVDSWPVIPLGGANDIARASDIAR